MMKTNDTQKQADAEELAWTHIGEYQRKQFACPRCPVAACLKTNEEERKKCYRLLFSQEPPR